MNQDYKNYINSKEWGVVRKRIRARDKVCQGCGFKKNLHVHHKTYIHFKHELDEELVLICRACHEAVHYAYDHSKESLWKVTDGILENRKLGMTLSKSIKVLPAYQEKKRNDRKEAKKAKRVRKAMRRKYGIIVGNKPKKVAPTPAPIWEPKTPAKPIGLVAQALAKYKK